LGRSTFSKRLFWLALVVSVFQLFLAVSPLPTIPWSLLAEAFLIGTLVLHKRSATHTWLNASTDRPLRVFLKSFVVYGAPACVLWALFVAGIVKDYLPRIGLIPIPPLVAAIVAIGVVALSTALVGNELSKLGRPPQ
jgi:hypothetical protein